MKIAITTPTGHVGSVICNDLLEHRKDVRVRLLARHREKIQPWIDRGAEAAIGSQEDADYLRQATQGIDALFWCTPPNERADDLRAFQNRLGAAAAQAAMLNRVDRVVNLSSIGAQLDSRVGPINGLHDIEKLFDESVVNVTHLRAGFFGS